MKIKAKMDYSILYLMLSQLAVGLKHHASMGIAFSNHERIKFIFVTGGTE